VKNLSIVVWTLEGSKYCWQVPEQFNQTIESAFEFLSLLDSTKIREIQVHPRDNEE